MLKRLINIKFSTKRCLPVLQYPYCTDKQTEVKQSDDISALNVVSFSENAKLPSKTALPVLMKLLEIDETKASHFIMAHKENFNLLTLSQIVSQLTFFIDSGIPNEIILKFPQIVVQSPEIVQKKVEILREFPSTDNFLLDYFPLLQLNTRTLKKIRKKLETDKKIHILAEKLNVAPHVISELCVHFAHFLSLRTEELLMRIDTLFRHNITPEKIIQSPTVLVYSCKFIEKRLREVMEVRGEDKVEPWLVQCTPEHLERSFTLAKQTRATLKTVDAEDQLDYLSKRLGYARDEVESFLRRYPQASRVRVVKLAKTLDFLLDEAGHTPTQILNLPRILTRSLKHLKERYKELKDLGFEMSTMSLFAYCQTKKEYEKFIKARRKLIENDRKNNRKVE